MTRGTPRRIAGALAVATLVAVAGACDSSRQGTPDPATTTTTPPTATTLRGAATLDGEPFDAQWIGALVLDDDLVTSCQQELPPIEGGRFSVPVFNNSASAGCGREGAEVVFWTFANDKTLYSTRTFEWPADAPKDVDVEFRSTKPLGAGTELRQYQGAVFNKDGTLVPVGTKVEAFVGDTLCGVAGVRFTGETDGYIMAVVGPDVKPECTKNGAITFKVNGKPATTSRSPEASRETLDLRLE